MVVSLVSMSKDQIEDGNNMHSAEHGQSANSEGMNNQQNHDRCFSSVEQSLTPFCEREINFYDDSNADPTCRPTNDPTTSYEDEHNGTGKKISTWKQANPSLWKVNLTKDKRSKCLPYKTKSGLKAAKQPKSIDCRKCRFKCQRNFTEDERKKICELYWGIKDYQRQKEFILKYVKASEPKRKTIAEGIKSRHESRAYYLQNAKGEIWRVCGKFFEKTLCISNGPVNLAMAKKNLLGCFDGIDHRGKKPPGNKTKDRDLSLVQQHIESFPTVPGRYVQQSSSKMFLDGKLSIRKMYELYCDFCASINETPVTCNVYRKVFGTHNFSFFRPKKDQCTICTKFDLSDPLKKRESKEYDLDIQRKDDSKKSEESG
ncbi:hypothetical protein FKM82_019608 [Ascaphus truei]